MNPAPAAGVEPQSEQSGWLLPARMTGGSWPTSANSSSDQSPPFGPSSRPSSSLKVADLSWQKASDWSEKELGAFGKLSHPISIAYSHTQWEILGFGECQKVNCIMWCLTLDLMCKCTLEKLVCPAYFTLNLFILKWTHMLKATEVHRMSF